MAESNPAASAREERGKSVIARELGGDLPCARCRYNLKGLSIRAVCPECALPVRATVLAVVDPRAHELRPLKWPRLVAFGMLLWSFAAAGAMAWSWGLTIIEISGVQRPGGGRGLGPALLVALSGVGALALIRPHAMDDSGRGTRAAIAGVLAYLPLCGLMYFLHARLDPSGAPAYGPSAVGSPERVVVRLGINLLIVAIALALRPNARMLAARSFLMRTGRTDRQTLRALASVLVLCVLGDLMRLGALQFEGGGAQLADQVAQLLVMLGSVLFSVGLVGVCVDCARLFGVILEPPLSMQDLLGTVETAPGRTT
ncbi:MAG: hypothetical protein WC718_06545 [Phycisphaerales bacterium]|jgi:hypothetical protein